MTERGRARPDYTVSPRPVSSNSNANPSRPSLIKTVHSRIIGAGFKMKPVAIESNSRLHIVAVFRHEIRVNGGGKDQAFVVSFVLLGGGESAARAGALIVV